jgi:hypothetical protein
LWFTDGPQQQKTRILESVGRARRVRLGVSASAPSTLRALSGWAFGAAA